MNLSPGTRLGPYEVVAPLGAGGMGEVYRARDTRLGRDVAIKVLPQHLSSSAEVRARFEREAKTISGLNHPYICTLFDVGREGDADYLVMELIEGETLATRLIRGALPAAEALKIGSQIADALERAHRAGVVHRDLKPGNIMLTKSGAKLMDFGLARATGMAGKEGSGVSMASLTQSPTEAQPLTAEGTIVGTFQYMAPEQLEGREADARSDLWALGCVLYEMTTGKRAFDGKSQASLITSIMGSTPAPISQISPMSPPAIDGLVRDLLSKDPDDRVQSAHDVKLQLARIIEGGSQAGAPAVSARRRVRGVHVAWLVVAGVVVGLLATIWHLSQVPRASDVVTRTTIDAPAGTLLEIVGDNAGPPALSPDGSMLVFAAVGGRGGKRLWLRRIDELKATPLPGTDDASYPFWSPDGRSIGFFTLETLKRLDLAEGSIITLSKDVMSARGGSWSKSGVIVSAPSFRGGLSRIPATGGTWQPVTEVDTLVETTHRFPQMMPDGKHFVYLSALHTDLTGAHSSLWFGSLDGGKPKRLFSCPSNAVYADGFLFFVRDSTLMAQEFDPSSGTLEADPMPTREVVQLDPTTWNATVTVSDNGILVYGLGGRVGSNRVGWYDRKGQLVRNVTAFGNHLNIDLSPDNRRAAVETQQTALADLWVIDINTGTRTRITTQPDDDGAPIWMPDGNRILYAALHNQKYSIAVARADGSAGEETFLTDETRDVWPLSVSHDGRRLVFGRGDFGGLADGEMCMMRLDVPDATPRVLVARSEHVMIADISPDGRWMAFSSSVSGSEEIYVSPMPSNESDGLSARWQVSSSGGDCPRWRGDSRELYYIRPDNFVMAVAVDGTGREFHSTGETALFQVFQRRVVVTLVPASDGQHFLINALGGSEGAPLALVTGWQKSLRAR